MGKFYTRFFVIVLFISVHSLFAQEIIFRGRVRHANTYQEIQGVNIYIAGTNIGTTSDVGGYFTLKVSSSQEDWVIVFQHVAFYPLEISLSQAKNQDVFYLQPRVIQLPGISVVAEKEAPQILKDIPQPHSIISAESFAIRGYVDAGDLLKIEQSIQVDEELSGKKTVGIRGGNPDDVIVLYNGVKMNNLYDNVFDLSLINLEEVDQLEIIRGSNTAIYGAEANSGVINIVPKRFSRHTVKIQQKIGTYALGAWSVHLNRNFLKKLNMSYSYKQGGAQRYYSDSLEVDNFLKNMKTYHTASLVYDFSEEGRKDDVGSMSVMYLNSKLDYENNQYNEDLSNLNQMFSLRYAGHIGMIKNVSLAGSYQWLDEEQVSSVKEWQIDRHFLNRALNIHAEKRFSIQQLELLLAYQFEDSELDFQDEREIPDEQSLGIESALLSRRKQGLVSIMKLHVPTESEFYKSTDFDISYRYDNVQNRYNDVIHRSAVSPTTADEEGPLHDDHWKKSMLKFSSHMAGSNEYFKLNVYLNYGTNFKFPTMFQQLSSPSTLDSSAAAIKQTLKPEKNSSTEIGIELTRGTPEEANLSGWKLNANYFRSSYDNKIRMFYVPYSPIAYYDNVQNAEISGFEAKASIFLLRNKFTLEFGSSNYSISEKVAFPFKSEHKHVVNLLIEHAGYSLQVHGFKESEQVGWIRNMGGTLSEIRLKGYSNIDLHLSKAFEFYNIEFFVNFSARNLLDDDTKIEGLTLRDRRFYFTFGIQY